MSKVKILVKAELDSRGYEPFIEVKATDISKNEEGVITIKQKNGAKMRIYPGSHYHIQTKDAKFI